MKKVPPIRTSRRYGFDLHGVIDSDYIFFGQIFERLLSRGDEVYIITGNTANACLRRHLARRKIKFTVLFSVYDLLLTTRYTETDSRAYHFSAPASYCYEPQVLLNPHYFNRVKSQICESNSVELMVDDSDAYLQHFRTPFFKWKSTIRHRRALLKSLQIR